MKSFKKHNFTSERLKEVLQNIVESSRNHYRATCPFCYKDDHFYINKSTFLWDCKKCGEKGNLFKLLRHCDKSDLLEFETELFVPKLFSSKKREEIQKPSNSIVKLPATYKRVYKDKYLSGRGFSKFDFKRYEVGRVKHGKYRNYVLFPVLEAGVLRGFLGRIVFDKKTIKSIEFNTGKSVAKYRNEGKFNRLLYGIDEINFYTKTVIIVEGVFDKIKVDKRLRLSNSPSIKCVATFGKSVSDHQINELKCRKHIESLVIAQDSDAIEQTRILSQKTSRFFNVKIAFLEGDEDVDSISEEKFFHLFSNLKTVEEFNSGVVKKILLK